MTTVRKFTAQAISLGSKIEDELYFQSFSENNKSLFDKVMIPKFETRSNVDISEDILDLVKLLNSVDLPEFVYPTSEIIGILLFFLLFL